MTEINALADEFKACQKILAALGDETRQHIIIKMMQIDKCTGVREGTKNYYYFDVDASAMNQLLVMVIHVKETMESLPDRTSETI